MLYDKLTQGSYLAWLRHLSVRYVVLSDAQPDYSAKHEIALLRSGRSGLPVVFRTAHFTIYAVPSPTPIVTGPGSPRVEKADRSRTITLALSRPGRYQLGIRYTPYLARRKSCVTRGQGRDDGADRTERRDGQGRVLGLRVGRARSAHRQPDDLLQAIEPVSRATRAACRSP